MPSDVPAQISPQDIPLEHPQPSKFPISSHELSLGFHEEEHYDPDDPDSGLPPPPSLLSPAFTPPSTPGSSTPTFRSKSIAVDSTNSTGPRPKLLQVLPEVECVVRARIPTTSGQEMFLHLYTNNVDNKEHLAIVFGPHIRSKSLDKERPGESEMDRMIRGAYTGKLYPGRTSSKLDAPDQHSIPSPQDQPRRESGYQAALKASKSLLGHSDIPSQQPRTPQSPPSPATPASPKSPTMPNSPDLLNESSQSLNSQLQRVILEDDNNVPRPTPPLVRIHSECYTGETVWSARCDCGEQLDEAARLMSLPSPVFEAASTVNGKGPMRSPDFSADGSGFDADLVPSDEDVNPGGVIIYLRQEGRGIGLSEKLKAYNLQDLGNDTVEANILLRHPADARSYGLATAMLLDLGLDGDRGIRLLTNNPDKIRAVEGPKREIIVRERVAMVPLAWKTGGKQGIRSKEVESYLKTKIEQFGHMISDAK